MSFTKPIIFFCFLLSSVATIAQELGFSNHLLVKNVHDFGNIYDTKKILYHKFEFYNASERPITITKVDHQCGCIVKTWSEDPIMPQTTGYLEISFDPKDQSGTFIKTITVHTDWDKQAFELEIKGNVLRQNRLPLSWRNSKGHWLTIDRGINMGLVYSNRETTPVKVQVFNNASKTIHIEKIITPRYIEVVAPEEILPNNLSSFTVSFDGTNQLGYHNDQIEFWTDDDLIPIKTFTVYTMVEEYFPLVDNDEFATAPIAFIDTVEVDLGVIEAGIPVRGKVVLQNFGKQELIIRKLMTNHHSLTTSVNKKILPQYDTAWINFTYTPPMTVGYSYKTIILFTNDPKNPTQSIQVQAKIE